ncbi:MAG: metallopeptidase family protein [Deltaproteobacteria bacterium]|nr:metallopeptidase family protein [Deltaproteobacteria bacterium]
MSRQDRLAADLERGFKALEEGQIDDALTVLERVEKIDRHNADVVTLAAAIADAQADFPTALAKYQELAQLRPDDPMPRVCIARILLQDQGDAEGSLAAIEQAFDFIDEEDDLIEAVIVRTEALLALDDIDTARESLAELSTSVIDNAEIALDLGELALAAEDLDAAKRWIEIVRKEPELEAEAQHLIGRICEAAGDRKGMVAAWQRVRELDAKLPSPPVSISEDELERIAAAALAELPALVRDKLQRAPILIDDYPSADLIDEGLDPRMLGVFSGTPMTEGGASAPSVTNIRLFKTNLERSAVDLDHLAEEIRITVLHETAHYFGLDEADLERIGLD